MTQLKLGILPPEIETGRFTPIYNKTIQINRNRLPSARICKLCDIESCEDEFHFIFICPEYNEIRQRVLGSILNNFERISTQEQLIYIYIMQNHQRNLTTYIKDA